MQPPETPKEEARRLQTLLSLNILDTQPEDRFDRVTRLAKRLFDVPIALVSLVDEKRQWFKSAAGLDATETPREISFCGHAILKEGPFVVQDASQDVRFSDNPLVSDDPNIRFYAAQPLTVNGSRLGTLCIIDREPRDLEQGDQDLLCDLASMVEQELAAVQMATIDSLTQISNKRGFEALAVHSMSLCQRLGKSAALLFIDLDKFKAINDRFGHAEGDHALKSFARILQTSFRDCDVFGRLGGDEFAVLVTNVGPQELSISTKRLRQAVAQHNEASERGYDLEFSLGAIWFNPKEHASIRDLMSDADGLMYEQKRRTKGPVQPMSVSETPENDRDKGKAA